MAAVWFQLEEVETLEEAARRAYGEDAVIYDGDHTVPCPHEVLGTLIGTSGRQVVVIRCPDHG